MNNLNILYEDNHVIVVIKPAGVLSQSDITGEDDMLTIIKKYLKEKYNKPGNVYLGLVHRLDRPVGGIMVFAKTSKAAKRLNEQIKNHVMHKSYYAIVYGNVIPKKGTFKDTILKLDNKKVLLNDPKGKEAILNYEVISSKDNLSLVDINLITGRYHQIRLQFSSRKYPLYGDALYGNDQNKNIALFAYKLEFEHPVSKEILTFTFKPKDDIWQKFI